MKYKQVLKCPKCKTGTFVSSKDPNIFVICDNCGHTLWNGIKPQNPKK